MNARFLPFTLFVLAFYLSMTFSALLLLQWLVFAE